MSITTPAHTAEATLAAKLEEAHKKVEVGAFYTHYRSPDKPYKVLAVALLEGTEEPCVVYQAQYGSNILQGTIWVRSLDVWLSEVSFEGKMVPRFQKVL